MPNACITQVKVIQNLNLWKRFQIERESLELKWNANPKSLMLWHGTRNTDPKAIYEGEQGFNINYASAGSWGNAIYFA